MNAIAFDTLKLARGLEEAGFEHTQALKTAEILASTIGETVVTRDYLDIRLKELETSTKRDIKELDAKLANVEISLKHELDTKLATVKADILKWMFGALLAQTALIATLVKLFL